MKCEDAETGQADSVQQKTRVRTTTATKAVRILGRSALAFAVIALAVFAAFGYFDRDPVNYYPARGVAKPVAVVNFSGDMGLRFLLGASTSRGLTENGYPVVGLTSPVLFRTHRTAAEVDAIIAQGIRTALARTGAQRIVVMGQSYGADVVQTGLAHLPADLRPKVAAVILILPGNTVYFRADPTGQAYTGKSESDAAATVNSLTWAPLTCIQGIEETDSLCPLVRLPGANVIAMPGGHTINHDEGALLRHVIGAVERAEARPAQ